MGGGDVFLSFRLQFVVENLQASSPGRAEKAAELALLLKVLKKVFFSHKRAFLELLQNQVHFFFLNLVKLLTQDLPYVEAVF